MTNRGVLDALPNLTVVDNSESEEGTGDTGEGWSEDQDTEDSEGDQ